MGYRVHAKNITCPRDLPYAPILAVPVEVRDLDPAWKSCTGGLYGVYDPPYALASEGVLEVPITSASPTTLTAAFPAPTAQPVTPMSTTTQEVRTSAAPAVVPRPSSILDESIRIPASFVRSSETTSAATSPADAHKLPTGDIGGLIASLIASSLASASTRPTAAPSHTEAPIAQPAAGDRSGVAGSPVSVATVVSSRTLHPGEITTINNTPVSVGTSHIVIGGSSTVNFPAAASTPGPAVTVGGQIIWADLSDPSAIVAIDTATIGASGSPGIVNNPSPSAKDGNPPLGNLPATLLGATIPAQIISGGTQGLVIGGSTIRFSLAATTRDSSRTMPAAVVAIGSQVYTAFAGPSGNVVLASMTLSAGDPAVTISGQIISAAAPGIVIDGSTHKFSTPAPTRTSSTGSASEVQAVFTISGTPYTAYQVASSNGIIILAGASITQTISLGGTVATLNGQVISIAPSGLSLAGSATIIPFSTITPAPVSAVPTAFGDLPEVEATFTVSGTPYTAYQLASSTGIILIASPSATRTLSIGGPAATINGQVVSAAASGLVLERPSTTSTVTNHVVDEATFTAGGRTHTVVAIPGAAGAGAAVTAVVFDGSRTLELGGPAVTVDGETVSLGSAGVVVGGSVTASLSKVTLGPDGGIVSVGSGLGPWSGTGAANAAGSTVTTSVVGGSSDSLTSPASQGTPSMKPLKGVGARVRVGKALLRWAYALCPVYIVYIHL